MGISHTKLESTASNSVASCLDLFLLLDLDSFG